jgi:oligoribonuclease
MLAWMDLEMTGLDPRRHTIVEIATLVTDDDLEIVAVGPDLVVHATPEELAQMDSFVRQMHTHSGLLAAIEASTVSLAEAGEATLRFLKEQLPEPKTVPLAGNSIGTDRRFLATYLPEVEEWLHYRSVDVSTIKELCRRWYPESLAEAPAKHTAHRAMDDIRESVAELAFYRNAIFRAAAVSATAEEGNKNVHTGDAATAPTEEGQGGTQ